MSAEKVLPRYTIEDYQRWKGDWELWEGHAIAMSPSPFGRHQAVAIEMAVALRDAIKRAACDCHVLYELDWVVDRSTVVRPDLVVICTAIPERHLESPPELVVEVLSPSTRDNDLHYKRELYLSQGVGTYLIVDPDTQSIYCHRSAAGRLISETTCEHLSVRVCGDCHLQINVRSLFP